MRSWTISSTMKRVRRPGFFTPINEWLDRATGWRIVPTAPARVKSLQFYVPVRSCISGYGFAYDNELGYHPLTALLKEYAHDPQVGYDSSSLKIFYERFVPTTLQDALFGKVIDYSGLTARLLFTDDFNKIRVPAMPMPWSTAQDIRRYSSRTYQTRGRLSGEGHFTRAIAVYESIKTAGFQPAIHSDGTLRHGFIRGVVLRDGASERFVITGGQHRVAALASLGWDHIPVIFEHHMSGTPPVVDLRNAAYWPVVQDGLYDLRAATRVFDALFTDYGRGKERHFGLVNPIGAGDRSKDERCEMAKAKTPAAR